ncbi:hypothetical protein [Flavilitoribacter nigricans]|uniref:Glycosyltransferase RgtA/B/C/D-like domain-containing protein n=1 Tax=Flavilitoribacter nigricans (strain ATCC 23147 / DSM 23189 / NBRC 102662 / NCIMB 1420 / SS-2) TaxID=1122177 RepID=A0A2D0ND97_FLAN2|nr:hypothetical protein [Flavilitoribacter nigricans]PHN06455.1 hypothetical protein CRP01_12875 [Flavilitoribacter nigricans DSM 23189 = NBRC 102662]
MTERADQTTGNQIAGRELRRDVFLPFLASRLVLILFGYLAQVFPYYFNYPTDKKNLEIGWEFISWKWIDFWGRWDTAWYLNIIDYGYVFQGDPAMVKSNIAFYPLYPYVVKTLAHLLPIAPGHPAYLIIGLVIANLAALTALSLIYKLALHYIRDRKSAKYTIWLMLAFPSGFILSCFYTESMFLCLAAASLWFGSRQKWAFACLCIMFAAITRPIGLGLGAPLAYLYMEARNWDFRKIRPDVLWFLITPLLYIGFLYHIELISGDFLTTFQVQQAWDRHFSMPWKTLINPYGWNLYHTPIQQLITLIVFYGVYLAFRHLPSKALPLMVIVILLPIFFTGRLSSCIRYYLMAFPVFMAYAVWLQKDQYRWTLLIAAGLLQLVYFMGWARFYWIM